MTLLALHEVGFKHHSSALNLFKQLNFNVSAGECHCICGLTGSGKSTLLQLMAMPSEFNYQGQIEHHRDLRLGLVMQDPNLQLIRETIGAEVAFGLENLACPVVNMLPEVVKALTQVGLALPLDTLVTHLSLGQKYRLMMAAQLVLKPNLLLIDEPWAQLDNQGIQELISVLTRLLSQGISVVMTEHNPADFSSTIDCYWQLEGGELNKQELIYLPSCDLNQNRQLLCRNKRNQVVIEPDHDVTRLSANEDQEPLPERDKGENLLTLSPLAIQFNDEDPILFLKQTLHLKAGDIVGLFGDNGCGKTSLLNQIVGIDTHNQAHISLLGKPPKLGLFGAELGFLMQRPSRQLFEVTVRQELEFSLKRFGLPLSRATEMLTQLELTHLSTLSPHKLSYGQQHLIALASVLCVKPKVLLLDDPFAGLDNLFFSRVISCLKQFTQRGGAIIVTSHRPVLLELISKLWRIEGSQLTEHQHGLASLQHLTVETGSETNQVSQ
jgi:energy-coupling factor transporter ATP-binding protein EcfA2